MVTEACITDTCRRFDPITREWVYEVACVRTDGHDCATEPRELFRQPQATAAATVAPWTDEQVAALNRWQASGVTHPYTCGRCRDRDTAAEIARYEAAGKPDGFDWRPTPEHALVATNDGWVCETCDYTQDWASAIMTADPAEVVGNLLRHEGDPV